MTQLTKEQQNDLYLRKVALGEVQGEMTGYASVDKPWLKYYSEEAINSELPEGTIYEYLLKNSKECSANIAIDYFGKKITYQNIIDKVDMTARAFWKCGVRKGDFVTLCVLNTPEIVYSVYALSKIDAVADFEYPTIAEQTMYETLQGNHTKVFIVLSVLKEKFSHAGDYVDKVIVISPDESMPLSKKIMYKLAAKDRTNNSTGIPFSSFTNMGADKEVEVEENRESAAPVIMVHTGGTTGFPKGVLLSNKAFNAIAHEYRVSGMKYSKGDSILHGIPPFHAYGFSIGIHMPLILGLTIYMCVKIDYNSLAKMFRKIKPVHFVGASIHTTTIIDELRDKPFELSHMKTWAIGGSSLSKKQLEEATKVLERNHCGTRIVTGYGMSELCATACTERGDCLKPGSVGIPLPHVNIKVMDEEQDKELTYDQVGGIWINSPGIMIGYQDNKEENQKVFQLDSENVLWIKTGDLASIDQDGFLYLAGRSKRLYSTVYKGLSYKIFPDNIEKVVMELQGIKSCAAVCASDEYRRFIPILYVVRINDDLQETTIKEYCIDKLPEHMIPEKILFLGKIPMTAAGKVDYKALEEKES